MSREVIFKLDAYKIIEYGEDLESIEEKLHDILEEEGFSIQILESSVDDN